MSSHKDNFKNEYKVLCDERTRLTSILDSFPIGSPDREPYREALKALDVRITDMLKFASLQ